MRRRLKNLIIDGKNIRKKFRGYFLNNVNIEAEKGDIVGIIGANGSGKTTLLSIMAGTLKPDGGQLLYEGENVFKTKKFNKYSGYVPQTDPLIEDLTVKDNLKLWCATAWNSSVIYDFGINEFINKKVSKLSGGMKRRVSIAVALCKDPSVLLLDEPSAALDIYGKAEIRNYITEYVKRGGTVVMCTHDKDEISLCNKLYLMEKGVLKDYENKKN